MVCIPDYGAASNYLPSIECNVYVACVCVYVHMAVAVVAEELLVSAYEGANEREREKMILLDCIC